MHVGEKFRRLRTNGQVRVKDLATQTGLSPSFIYQFERGKVSPSYSTLKNLAHALGISFSVLLGEETPEEWIVARSHKRLRLVTGEEGVLVQIIPFLGLRSKRIQALSFELQPGASHRQILFEHDREDFFYLETGEIELELANRRLRLYAGDVAHFSLDKLLGFTNVGADTARGLWIVSPPTEANIIGGESLVKFRPGKPGQIRRKSK